MQAPGAWKLGQFSQKKYTWPHKLVSPFMSDPREGTKYIGITGERQNWRKVHLQILNLLIVCALIMHIFPMNQQSFHLKLFLWMLI